MDQFEPPVTSALRAAILAALGIGAFLGLGALGLSQLASAVAVIATATGVTYINAREALVRADIQRRSGMSGDTRERDRGR